MTVPVNRSVGDVVTAADQNTMVAWVTTDVPTGTITAAGSASAVSNILLEQFGPLIIIRFSFTIGTAITVPSDGNVTDTTVGQLSNLGLYPSAGVVIQSGTSGSLAKYTISTAGLIQIAAVSPGTSLAIGQVVTGYGLYPLT